MLLMNWGSVLIILPQMSVLRRRKREIVLLLLLFLTSGCLGMRMDNGANLTARDDFPAAVNAAPNWVSEALDIIAELEHRLESQ